eukprot:3236708-Pyramimonas_sp.AAC.1
MAGTCARRDLRVEASWQRCPKWLPSCGTTRSRSPACPRGPAWVVKSIELIQIRPSGTYMRKNAAWQDIPLNPGTAFTSSTALETLAAILPLRTVYAPPQQELGVGDPL